MENTKRTYYADLGWFSKEDHQIHGDMYFTFQESGETETEDVNSLKESMLDNAGATLLYLGWDDKDKRDKDDIPISFVMSNLYKEDRSRREDIRCHSAHVYASEEKAQRYGIPEKIREIYPETEEVVILDPDKILGF